MSIEIDDACKVRIVTRSVLAQAATSAMQQAVVSVGRLSGATGDG